VRESLKRKSALQLCIKREKEFNAVPEDFAQGKERS
jgi:hypothetical protein